MGPVVVWSPSTWLAWDDFEAEPHPGAYQDALALVRYACRWKVKSSEDGLHFTIDDIRLETEFVRNLSWVRARMATAALLEHVQGTFDLAEELRPAVRDSLMEIFSHREYPVRGSTDEERQQYSRQASTVVLERLGRMFEEMVVPHLKKYEEETDSGARLSVQQEYSRRFMLLRPSLRDDTI